MTNKCSYVFIFIELALNDLLSKIKVNAQHKNNQNETKDFIRHQKNSSLVNTYYSFFNLWCSLPSGFTKIKYCLVFILFALFKKCTIVSKVKRLELLVIITFFLTKKPANDVINPSLVNSHVPPYSSSSTFWKLLQ